MTSTAGSSWASAQSLTRDAGIGWLTDNGDGTTDVEVTLLQTGAASMSDDSMDDDTSGDDDMSMDDDMSGDDMSDDDEMEDEG